MKPHKNPFLLIAASLALLGSSAHAADVTLTAGTYTNTQIYNNGTISGVVTFDSGANYTFDSLNLPLAWNRVTLNSGASLTVAGNLSADVSGVSLNGGTLTTGGLLLHDSPNWNGSYNDGKQTIEYGDSIINGATIVANQSNANFISLASSPGGYGWAVANNLWLGNDGATIDSGIYNIGITMVLGNFSGQTGKLTKTGNGTLTLSAANTYSGITRSNAGTLILANANALQNSTLDMDGGDSGTVTFNQNSTLGGLTGSRALNMGGYTLTIGNNSSSSNYAGDLSNGALIKTGGGTLNLSGTNSYAGGTTVSAGSLIYANTAAKPATGTTTVAAGLTLGLGVGGSGDFSSSDVTSLFSDTMANVTMDSTSNVGIDTTAGDFTHGASVASTTKGLVKLGNNTLTMSGNLNYTGATSITAGTLVLSGENSGKTGITSVANGATLQLQANLGNTTAGISTALSSASTNSLSMGSSPLALRSDSDVTFAGGDNLGGLGSASVTIDVNQLTSGNSNKTLSFAAGGFNTYNTTINATGGNGYSLALGGINNGYNGTLTLNADTANLTIGHIGSASATSSLNVGGSATTTITGAINTSGNFTKSGSGTLNLTGSSSFTSVMIFEGGIVNAATFADNNTSSSLGAGTGDPNGDAIGLVFRGGTLQYTGSSAQSTNRAIRLSTTGGGGTIDASGSNPAATLSFTASSSPNLFENYGNRTLTLTGTNTGDNTFAMAITEAGQTSLVKSGTGKWVLTGTSNYSGATSVNEGTLVINGNHSAATSAVTVASGATLGGTGTLGGTLDVTGILAPGNSIGTLNGGTTTWNGGNDTAATIWQFELSGNSNASDSLNIVGNFLKDSTDGSTYKFDFMNPAPTTWGNVYTLVTWSGTTNFTLGDFSWTNLGGIYDGQPGTGFTLNANSLTFTAVPEPTSALAGLLLTAGLFRRRR